MLVALSSREEAVAGLRKDRRNPNARGTWFWFSSSNLAQPCNDRPPYVAIDPCRLDLCQMSARLRGRVQRTRRTRAERSTNEQREGGISFLLESKYRKSRSVDCSITISTTQRDSSRPSDLVRSEQDPKLRSPSASRVIPLIGLVEASIPCRGSLPLRSLPPLYRISG